MNKNERNCPSCNKLMTYSSRSACHSANQKECLCKPCASNKPERKRRMSIKMSGNNNPFYGKKHTPETISKIKAGNAKFLEDPMNRKKMARNVWGDKNPMHGRTVYSIWLDKYGKEEADRRHESVSIKKSISQKGKGLGRSPHHCCGRGWKGRYKDLYFRSLTELSYMIYLDENNIPWESAEKKEFTINYIIDGGPRTYKPDFIVNKTKLVEIKPINLQTTKIVMAKKLAAEEFCKRNGLTYELTDYPINPIKIKKYLDEKVIVFSKGFEQKFREYNRGLYSADFFHDESQQVRP